jgi:hypothetical protein
MLNRASVTKSHNYTFSRVARASAFRNCGGTRKSSPLGTTSAYAQCVHRLNETAQSMDPVVCCQEGTVNVCRGVTTARRACTATLLPNGKVLVAGE